jgi:hypothetical protein
MSNQNKHNLISIITTMLRLCIVSDLRPYFLECLHKIGAQMLLTKKWNDLIFSTCFLKPFEQLKRIHNGDGI